MASSFITEMAIMNDVDKHLQFKASTNTTLNEGIWKLCCQLMDGAKADAAHQSCSCRMIFAGDIGGERQATRG